MVNKQANQMRKEPVAAARRVRRIGSIFPRITKGMSVRKAF